MPASTKIQDRFSIGVIWTSGDVNKTIKPFNPVTTELQGQVLEARLSGLMRVLASYKARVTDEITFDLSLYYFLRTDDTTFMDSELDDSSNSPLLGLEAYGSVKWAPISDLVLTLGGGAFLPQTGKALNDDASVRWEASLGILLSLF
jgi:hypothetical protein